MSKAQVYIDGSVYSPADPYATAMVVQNGDVMWVGSDAGAASIMDDSMSKIELDGGLLTPSFIHAYQKVSSLDDLNTVTDALKKKGFSTAVLSTDNPGLAQHEIQDIDLYWLYETGKVENLPTGFLGFVWGSDTLDADEFGALVNSQAETVSFTSALVSEVIEFSKNYKQYELPVLRIDNFDRWSSEELLADLAQLQINVGINISTVTDTFDVHKVSAAAVPYYLVADALNDPETLGWETVRFGIEKLGLSARASFNSMTKGAARSFKSPLFLGQLVPDAPAAFSQWQVDELMVQTADSRVANWSTDPRARIPLLPVLEQGSEPTLIRTYPAR